MAAKTTKTRKKAPLTFVLVHGMWHGGWCWKDVADILRARGHAVTAPTQTGLGERSHLMSKDITFDTFIGDIVNHLHWNELEDVTLVGHSFAGAVILGVADRAPHRLRRLIFLDGAVMDNAETWFGKLPGDIADERLAAAQESSGGVSLPVGEPETFGVTEPDQVAHLKRLLTPHPLGTCTTPLILNAPPANGIPVDYIACTDPAYPPAAGSHKRARTLGWRMHELATGHDAMVSAPKATANLLEKVVGTRAAIRRGSNRPGS